NGIVLDAIDCSFVKSQLEQAKAKGIKVVPIYAYDCNDSYAGKGGQPLFAGVINYGPDANKNLGAFAEKYGCAQGQAAVAATGGKSPYTAATLLSIAPAIQQSGRGDKLYVMGGEGFQPELDLMRTHHGVSAVMISPSDWTGWAAIDSLNSLFQGKAPAYSGLG